MKNNKTNKKWSLLFSLILVFALFANACGNKVTEEPVVVDTTETVDVADQTTTDETVTEEAVTEETVAEETDATKEVVTEVNSEQAAEITVTLQVVYADGSSDSFDIITKETTLRKALEQEGLASGSESDYGLFIDTVNGVKCNADNEEWWCLTKGGEMWNNGVDTTEIVDGDQYELTLTVGY